MTLIWRNWAHTYKCSPKEYHRPATVDELRHLLKRASATKNTVKVGKKFEYEESVTSF
jgi:hypothetical protein